MKKVLSICLLWAFTLTLWGQTNGQYGGDFNPDSPANPQESSVTMKYDFKVTAEKGGYVNQYPSGNKFTKETQIQLNVNPNAGYQFKCWLENGKVISTSQWYYYTMPDKDVEIKAVFVFEPEVPGNPDVIPLDYRVTAEASPSRGGNVWYSTEEVEVGTNTYVSANSNNGYQFKGWLLDGILVSTNSHYNFEMQSRNMHFVAKFEFNPDVPGNPSNNPNNVVTYTLSYSIDDQICYSEQLPEGATITTIAIPTKKGHTFSGWSNVPTLMPANDLTISGIFIPNKYHVVYKVEDKIIHEEDVDYGTILTPPAGEAREGHTLTWKNLPTAMPDCEVVVEGYYSPNVYKLTYVVDGSVYKTFDVVYAMSITAEAEPSKEGHTFSGWSEIPETMPASDVTVTGSFSVNSYILTYIVDGNEYKRETVAYGTQLTAIDAPIKEGHTFSGWSEIPETMPEHDVAVTGSFTVNKYLVTFKIDNEVIASDSLEYCVAIVVPEAPEKEGYTFDGWGEVAETVPASDVTYEGTYTVNIYNVYYYVGEELVHTAEVAYGEVIPEYVYEPTEDGYTFLGWVGDTYETMPAHDVSYTANIDDTIEQLTIDNSQLIVYDLTGRKVTDTENLRGGIYIVNGKKVVLR